jgi:hypothetical protein
MSDMSGGREMLINDVRICDSFGHLSHRSLRTAKPDREHRTDSAIGQMNRLSKWVTPSVRFAQSPGKALGL